MFLGIALAGLACSPSDPPARSAILISIDTLRADRLGVYGHARPTSPNLDALAAKGAVFEDAWATSPWTLPSHASLLTGLLPSRHGARSMDSRLPADVPSLASQLALQGFDTGGVVNHVFVGVDYGMDNGFRDFLSVPPADDEPAAEAVIDVALRWLAKRKGTRVFLFVHFFDVHSDYSPSPELAKEFAPGPSRFDGSTAQLQGAVAGGIKVTEEDRQHLVGLYDAEIRQLDEALGGFLDRLDEEGWLDESLLVITSDHGEEFLEHGSLLHGGTQYQELLHVPLILSGPGIPSVRISEPVSLTDVAPTILARLGVKTSLSFDGVDLSPLLRGGSLGRGDRPLFSQAAPPQAEQDTLRAVRRGSLKLIRDSATGSLELYDLAQDPGEQQNLAEREPELVRELEGELDSLAVGEREPVPARPLSPQMRERLRALGYLK